jgi:hypothetical protein
MLRFRASLAALAAALGVASAPASAATMEGAEVSARLTESGDGLLSAASFSGAPGETWSWQICDSSGQACQPFASGQQVETGAAPAGVTFRALASDGPNALSPLWSGRVHLHSAPSVTGVVRANRLVVAVPAVWDGGWSGDVTTHFQLSACPPGAPGACIPLALSPGNACRGGSVIDPAFAGWTLRIASKVYGPDVVFALLEASPLSIEPAWKAGPTSAVATFGTIAHATGPRDPACEQPPLVPVDAASLSHGGAATVHCWAGCTVTLTATAGRHEASAHVRRWGTIMLRIPASRLAALGHGPRKFVLAVDGHVLARRVVKG